MTLTSFDRALRALARAKAPDTLAPGVYDRIGLRDSYVRLPTEIGDVYVAFGKSGVTAVRRAKNEAAFEAWYAGARGVAPKRVAKPVAKRAGAGAAARVAALVRKLRRGFAGEQTSRFHVDLSGVSPFARAVLEKTREIPRGQVRPYAWVAREIGHPYAARAVGTALAKNPVPLVIPCHRVVRSDGAVGSYVFGSPAKRALLAFEGALPA